MATIPRHRIALVHVHALDFWLARAAVACIAGLQMLLINDFTIGPRWLAPTLELALLVPLAAATAWHQGETRRAQTNERMDVLARYAVAIRASAVLLTGVVSLINFGALLLLVRALLHGSAGPGSTLLLDALNIWTINVIVFALWYWTLDRGGPSIRSAIDTRSVDFLFPQMTLQPPLAREDFTPGFVDYLFLSFSTATAFSATDTAPLSHRAKLMMMLESAISLLTVALVAARAVNILA
jgi:hypothetical protein